MFRVGRNLRNDDFTTSRLRLDDSQDRDSAGSTVNYDDLRRIGANLEMSF